MAKKRLVKRIKTTKRSNQHRLLKVMCAVTIIAAYVVLFVGGMQAGVRTVKIIYKCLVATIVIGMTFGIVIKAVASYEEINRG
ncbi:MAG: hypothetical protein RL326_1849 [Pseudomonadota bacterium]|jgi:choline-glycine betaine transporter